MGSCPKLISTAGRYEIKGTSEITECCPYVWENWIGEQEGGGGGECKDLSDSISSCKRVSNCRAKEKLVPSWSDKTSGERMRN